jgi:hypothetical protein
VKNYPVVEMCHSCFRAEDVKPSINALTGMWDYLCTNLEAPNHPFTWSKTPPSHFVYAPAREGYLADLGVYDDLLGCIHPTDTWLEYGIVEDRYRRFNPTIYARLVREFSHSARNAVRGGPDVNPDQSPKVSSRLASALSHLASEGLISKSFSPATGYWDYNGTISHWGPIPPRDAGVITTWVEYATAKGLNPNEWTLP